MSTSRGREGRTIRVGERRLARERALGICYEAEVKSIRPSALLAELSPPPAPYCRELIVGLEANAEQVEGLVTRHATNWAVDRMPAVDRDLLRLSTFELVFGEVPVAVVIDEAVELAKQYSTEDSPGFVNGVLSAIAAELHGPEAK